MSVEGKLNGSIETASALPENHQLERNWKSAKDDLYVLAGIFKSRTGSAGIRQQGESGKAS
jgi:hypothetical protein